MLRCIQHACIRLVYCILLMSAGAGVDLWLNSMDWHGSKFTIRTPLRTDMPQAWSRHCCAGNPSSCPPLPLPLLLVAAWRGSLLSGQSTDQTMRVLEGAASPCRRLAIYPLVTQFLYACMRTKPDNFRLVGIEFKTAIGAPLSYFN